ncbi:MAG: 30S ribosomal protein S3 [Candidatus Pacebacteria bacterium CG10_big_fil_rev_8_21_14_0_10_56_10]|nr:MAG: 30S ribosomal protein S3 [Candidatus Pacebacteria bacterium CG10_big_fil_rev_8_21_14_0_10_56_10]
MGQKVHPISFRLGNTFSWKSRWYADQRSYSRNVLGDYRLRQLLHNKLGNAGLVTIDIERSLTSLSVVLVASRPGVVIGKGGENLKLISQAIEKLVNTGKVKQHRVKIDIKVEEMKTPDLSAKLVAERIADQLSKRYPHRRAVRQALDRVTQAGAEGIKIVLSGRIGGSEIGRTEKYTRGKVPTQTLRANLDYFQSPSLTRSGYVGVKVWIYKGEVQ